MNEKPQKIDSAPRGVEVLAWRRDCGWFIAKYTHAAEFLTDSEQEELTEDELFSDDWFFADFIGGGRLDGDMVPTHWLPLPPDVEQ